MLTVTEAVTTARACPCDCFHTLTLEDITRICVTLGGAAFVSIRRGKAPALGEGLASGAGGGGRTAAGGGKGTAGDGARAAGDGVARARRRKESEWPFERASTSAPVKSSTSARALPARVSHHVRMSPTYASRSSRVRFFDVSWPWKILLRWSTASLMRSRRR